MPRPMYFASMKTSKILKFSLLYTACLLCCQLQVSAQSGANGESVRYFIGTVPLSYINYDRALGVQVRRTDLATKNSLQFNSSIIPRSETYRRILKPEIDSFYRNQKLRGFQAEFEVSRGAKSLSKALGLFVQYRYVRFNFEEYIPQTLAYDARFYDKQRLSVAGTYNWRWLSKNERLELDFQPALGLMLKQYKQNGINTQEGTGGPNEFLDFEADSGTTLYAHLRLSIGYCFLATK
jgi:hypothetical protein